MSKNSLEDWFLEHQRAFPWREGKTPYKVWISEVMLQQTRASVVVPYFLRWMNKYPDVKALYNASIEEVIKDWEGLGYYSRARNLHRAAAMIVEEFNGMIPDNKEDLMRIHGFGPYTVGAILSFGFQKRAVAVDGNAMRVISRYFSIEKDIAKGSTRKEIEEKADQILDEKEPWITSEAIIELGAIVCTPKPQCHLCPLQTKCLANKKNIQERLPIKTRKESTFRLFREVFVFENNAHFLVKKGEKGRVMADLFEFPFVEVNKFQKTRSNSVERAKKYLEMNDISLIQYLPQISHTFTKYKAQLYPILLAVSEQREIEGFKWMHIEALSKLPFSAGHRKILTELCKIYKLNS